MRGKECWSRSVVIFSSVLQTPMLFYLPFLSLHLLFPPSFLLSLWMLKSAMMPFRTVNEPKKVKKKKNVKNDDIYIHVLKFHYTLHMLCKNNMNMNLSQNLSFSDSCQCVGFLVVALYCYFPRHKLFRCTDMGGAVQKG